VGDRRKRPELGTVLPAFYHQKDTHIFKQGGERPDQGKKEGEKSERAKGNAGEDNTSGKKKGNSGEKKLVDPFRGEKMVRLLLRTIKTGKKKLKQK